jgi:hypothetical protein
VAKRPHPKRELGIQESAWYFIAEQQAPAPHLAHPEGCAALSIVLVVTVPRVSRSCENFPNGFGHTPTIHPSHPKPAEKAKTKRQTPKAKRQKPDQWPGCFPCTRRTTKVSGLPTLGGNVAKFAPRETLKINYLEAT